MTARPGLVVLFGSGETSASGRRVLDWAFGQLQAPVNVAVLETPAGFELNSAQVAGRVADFIRERLQNYRPEVVVVPARRRGSAHSPDDPSIVAPIRQSNAIFIGPGSPSYAVRQLRDSLAWKYVQARHQRGAILVAASAAAIAISAYALPVYEIYKVGEDPHWKDGLDLFGPIGLSLVFVPHWDNAEGGDELDTSCCFMGRSRFEQLLSLLPREVTVVGVDEHTALAVDFAEQACRVLGLGSVTLVKGGAERRFASGEVFPLGELGSYSLDLWSEEPSDLAAAADASSDPAQSTSADPPEEVLRLVAEREAARHGRNWSRADALRARILSLGWQVSDTSKGTQVTSVVG